MTQLISKQWLLTDNLLDAQMLIRNKLLDGQIPEVVDAPRHSFRLQFGA